MNLARLERRLRRERDREIWRAERADHDWRFAANEFKGPVAGPRLRAKYADIEDEARERIVAIEESLGIE